MDQLEERYQWAPKTAVAYFNRMYPTLPSLEVASSFKFYESLGAYGVDQESALMVLEGTRRCTLFPETVYLRFFFTRAKPVFYVLLLNESGVVLNTAEIQVSRQSDMPSLLDDVLRARFDPGPAGRLVLEEYDSVSREKEEKRLRHLRATERLATEIIRPKVMALWKEIQEAIAEDDAELGSFGALQIRSEIISAVTDMANGCE
jgi:hypothetical protein